MNKYVSTRFVCWNGVFARTKSSVYFFESVRFGSNDRGKINFSVDLSAQENREKKPKCFGGKSLMCGLQD